MMLRRRVGSTLVLGGLCSMGAALAQTQEPGPLARTQEPAPSARTQEPAPSARTQTPEGSPAVAARLPTVVVTGSVTERALSSAPYAATVLDADTLRLAGPMVNLSEALARVPGITANNRQNYAQDLQLSSRGFGARAPFGVRGLRLYTDGIPATMPDGQGQVTHFDLASAQRVEVVRGPFTALYGNSSGGVIATVSAPVARPAVELDLDAGANGLRQARVSAAAPLGHGWEGQASASGFQIDGFRPQSEAHRTLLNGRLAWTGEADSLTLLANSLNQRAQDPLGLTRAQWNENPDQTTPQAEQFNTRKNATQTQLGGRWRHRFDAAGPLTDSSLVAYTGWRGVTQWQSITVGAQAAPGSGGGVVDFDRRYDGVDGRLVWRVAGGALSTGLNLERQRDDRQGYENFIGTGTAQQLGVTGALRRDEENEASTREAYAQWQGAVTTTLEATLGVRAGQVRMSTQDHFLSNGDDSGARRYRYANPALGLGWQVAEGLLLHAAAGQGFESPTLNELAYRPDGGGGFNADLKPQKSRQQEVGLKWRRERLELDATVFHIATRDEIAVLTNSGGRSSYQNVGRTRRSGLEVSGAWRFTPGWRTAWAVSTLEASYRDSFQTCTGTPCATANVPVAAGRRIAGTNGGSAFAELAWKPPVWAGGEAAVEWRAVKRTAVNDTNSEFAPGYGLLHLRLSQEGQAQAGRWTWIARVENLMDRRYVGSVIVNDGNGRFYEPAPGRTWWLGLKFTTDLGS
ncbi:iron complex outermembrane recepter protein [Roseateles sp. YR242]|uniref:TonB-dependent receptor family protein n=1 Tax=Roseateles sp. YR242 TaxID=1855305 RepID=UPI0008CEA420|nr:TonB-dependent receptor [Roseateles sp. YR242]SEL18205.1 iron complex outermembrane recepter protein [Roseateles sp. YR242]